MMNNFWLSRKLKADSFQHEIKRLKSILSKDIKIILGLPDINPKETKNLIECVVLERLTLEMKQNFEYYYFVGITNIHKLASYFTKYLGVQ